jgi:hypothetical protein
METILIGEAPVGFLDLVSEGWRLHEEAKEEPTHRTGRAS